VIAHSLHENEVVFKVQVVPRSSRSEVVGAHNGSLRIKIAAPPVDGAANEELIRVLAKTVNISRGAVTIVSGHTGKVKQISIKGRTNEVVARLNSDSWS
jgi:uncharacterized protein (TIGR00251 family)